LNDGLFLLGGTMQLDLSARGFMGPDRTRARRSRRLNILAEWGVQTNSTSRDQRTVKRG